MPQVQFLPGAYSLLILLPLVILFKGGVVFVAGVAVLLVHLRFVVAGTVFADFDVVIARLIRKFESEVVECAFVIELGFLHGREQLKGQEIFSLIEY